MKNYRVTLTRAYFVSIKAENEEDAKMFAEYYLGDCPDLSSEKNRVEQKFSIEDIEMVDNEATEIVEIFDENEPEIQN